MRKNGLQIAYGSRALPIDTIAVQTFSSPKQLGSLQLLHFYSSINRRNAAMRRPITDEFDHTYAVLGQENKVQLCWKNRSGEIQLCGTGAYAMAWYLSQKYPTRKKWEILTPNHHLKSTYQNPYLLLELPCQQTQNIYLNQEYSLNYDSQSGIYYLEVTHQNLLMDELKLWSILKKTPPKSIHGYCAFFWNQDLRNGLVRYFSPMHGRREDYVTGSIHCALSPLVYKKYHILEQKWTQMSLHGGMLNTIFRDDKVLIHGKVGLKDKFQRRQTGHKPLLFT